MRPTQILAKLCKENKMEPPEYTHGCVTVQGISFYGEKEIENDTGEKQPSQEHVALAVLKQWHNIPGGFPLVPEHIETRGLTNPEKPGVEHVCDKIYHSE